MELDHPSLVPGSTRPHSAVSLSLACFSLLVFLGALSYGLSKEWSSYAVVWWCSLSLLVPTCVQELVYSRKKWVVYEEHDAEHKLRLKLKRVGLFTTLCVWALAAALIPYFNAFGKTLLGIAIYPFTVLKNLGLNALLIFVTGLFSLYAIDRYIAFTDRRLSDPYDGFFQVGAWVLRKKALINPAVLKQHILQWIIKAFFLTLMLSWFNGNIANLQGRPWLLLYETYKETPEGLQMLFLREWGIIKILLFTIDLAFGMIGYVATFKLLGTHVRSAEPTLFGWVICLACYPPFNQATGEFSGFNDNADFVFLWSAHPTLCTIWACITLFLLSLYAFASVQFGVRFSNLTHRGILTNGLYRFTRHPAYLTKNLMWWLCAIPNILTIQFWQALVQLSHLILTNIIYYYRAKTEEAHLSYDPVYQHYSQWIDQHGLIARLRRLFKK